MSVLELPKCFSKKLLPDGDWRQFYGSKVTWRNLQVKYVMIYLLKKFELKPDFRL